MKIISTTGNFPLVRNKMSMKERYEMRNIRGGMFQYFLFFHPPKKYRFFVHLFSSEITIHNCVIQKTEPKTNTITGFNVKRQKSVKFTDKPSTKILHAWRFAYKQARIGKWEQAARDRGRFTKRIYDLDQVISRVLRKKCEEMFETWV